MVSSIYSLWKVNIENLVVNKVHICRNFHIQPSEIERLPYWEYEMMMKEMNETADKENKGQEEGKYDPKHYMDHAMSSSNKMMSSHMPKMPSMPKI